jgi:hypothetical protein
MGLAILRRSRLVQSLAYGCLLGVLSAVPTIVLQATGLFPRAVRLADEFALAGGVPFAVAGAVVWFLIVLRRGHTASTGSGALACWLGTVIVSYVLMPIWVGVAAVWKRCPLSVGPSLDQCWETFRATATTAAIISWWSFVFTAPVVLTFLLVGAWLWIRNLHPAIAGSQAA